MNGLYLIAHKVSGEPAFDVATRMECPLCHGAGCYECDDLGYWWIIPTSGHRAYPYHYWPWDELACDSGINECVFDPIPIQLGDMPHDLTDHYHTTAAPRKSLLAALGLTKPRPQPPIIRRI